MKAHISAWLRKLHLLKTAEGLRFYRDAWKYGSHNRRFIKSHPGIPFPPPYFIYETYKLNLQEYYEDGKVTASEIVALLSTVTDLSTSGCKVLDWGCGPGRITRHLPALLPATQLYATDYNTRYIEWCTRALPGITFSVNGVDPPLGFADAFFDAVIGFSVLTHLSARNHLLWIDELYRILKTGGLAFLTTQGLAHRVILLPAEQVEFDAGELITRENVKEGNRLFSAFQPQPFMRQLFGNKFEVIRFLEAPVGAPRPEQDIWLVKKRDRLAPVASD